VSRRHRQKLFEAALLPKTDIFPCQSTEARNVPALEKKSVWPN